MGGPGPVCGTCGNPVGDTAQFCGRCGQAVQAVQAAQAVHGAQGAAGAAGRVPPAEQPHRPAPPAEPGRGGAANPLVLGAITFLAVLLVGGGVGGWLLLGPDAGADQPEPPQPTPTSAPRTTTPAADTPATLAAADRAQVAALSGWWVPQLSSKRAGMVVDGVTYTESRIAEHARDLRTSYPEALLLNSSDYASYATPGVWVVVAGRPFGSAEGANAWCDAQGIGRDDCFAKRLAQDGPDGNTVHR